MTRLPEYAADCAFCARIAAGEYDDEYDGVVDFEPLNPVTPGHRLVVPKVHVADALESEAVSARVMAYAANKARTAGLFPCNLITSAGADASQTVFHLHLHIVPRRPGDGLALPWSQGRVTRPLPAQGCHQAPRI
jgi:histidine triad (HIT) family protein